MTKVLRKRLYLVLFSALLAAPMAQAQIQCNRIFTSSSISIDPWSPERFTDPKKHHDKSFLYHVHMLEFALYGTSVTPSQALNYFRVHIQGNSDSVISTSLINNRHRTTFGNYGFILRVPKKNIFAASDEDMGTMMPRRDDRSKNTHRNLNLVADAATGLPDAPAKLFTDPENHNELLVRGKVEESIQVIGILINYRVLSDGTRFSPDAETRSQLERLAKANNIPLIDLK